MTKRNNVRSAAATLWCALILSAIVSSSPLVELAPTSVDSDYFDPGGLMLLEVLRLSRDALAPAIRSSLLAFGACQLLVMVARAALFRGVLVQAGSCEGTPLRTVAARLRSFTAFLFLTVLKGLLGLAAVGIVAAALYPWGHRLYFTHGPSPQLLLPLGLGLLLAFFLENSVAAASDVARLAVFLPPNSARRQRKRWALVLLVLRRRFVLLASSHGIVRLWMVGHAGLALWLTDSRVSAPVTWLATALLVALSVFVETVWLKRVRIALTETDR